MKRKRILIDLDSTVADLLTPWLTLYNADWPDQLTVADITHWDLHLCAQGGVAIYDYLSRPGLVRNLLPYEGAVEGVKTLFDLGHELYIVTAAHSPVNLSEKAEWCQQHLPFLTKRQLVIAHEKHIIPADVLIDDSPSNALAYRMAHPAAITTGIRFPYNETAGAVFTFLADDWSNPKRAWDVIMNGVQ